MSKLHILLFVFNLVGAIRIGFHDSSLWAERDELSEGQPLSNLDQHYLEKSGLRAELEQMLSRTTSNMSFIFIGDSVVRNQFLGICLLLHAQLPFVQHDAHGHVSTCKGSGISATFFVTEHPDPEILSKLLPKGTAQPSVIYWNAAQSWARIPGNEGFYTDSVYPHLLTEATTNYAEVAPDSKMAFFLSHTPIEGLNRRAHNIPLKLMSQLNDIAQLTLQAQKDGQGRAIAVVDGFNLSKDKPTLTNDGVHYNGLVWEELKILLTAIL